MINYLTNFPRIQSLLADWSGDLANLDEEDIFLQALDSGMSEDEAEQASAEFARLLAELPVCEQCGKASSLLVREFDRGEVYYLCDDCRFYNEREFDRQKENSRFMADALKY